eukprot:TRINITY_DN33218_c0_g1_i1.p1 TRINITY_DN33218_c0_g1~~TRINITY_DN33218_c0_g1_i1.p1  ORF type:complete len:230 (-),score=29.63 TRINITY_DN33218_c0_g1_i1:107-733(-)
MAAKRPAAMVIRSAKRPAAVIVARRPAAAKVAPRRPGRVTKAGLIEECKRLERENAHLRALLDEHPQPLPAPAAVGVLQQPGRAAPVAALPRPHEPAGVVLPRRPRRKSALEVQVCLRSVDRGGTVRSVTARRVSDVAALRAALKALGLRSRVLTRSAALDELEAIRRRFRGEQADRGRQAVPAKREPAALTGGPRVKREQKREQDDR